MKIDYIEEGSSLRHLDIELPPENLTAEFEKGVRRLSRTARLPGFRKGKIPKDVIRSRFRADVLSQAVQELVPQALNEALNERKLRPLDDPRISNLESELGKPLRFRASFEVLPDIEVRGYEGIEITAAKTEVTDEQVESAIESLREQHARFDPVEGRGATDHDFVVGTLTEKPQDGGKEKRHEGVSIEVGSDAYHPSLHESLQGARAGDSLSLSVTFPADHPDSARAGKSFDVSFEVTELKQKTLPEADDELAKDLGDYETLDELRAALRARAEEEARRADEVKLDNQLIEKLIEANPFDPPDALVEAELDERLQAVARDLHRRGIDPNRAGIDWGGFRRNERAAAVKGVQAMLLLEQIARQEGLTADEERVTLEIERIASAVEKSAPSVRAQLIKDGSIEQLYGRLRREKVIDFVRQRAKLN